MLSAASSTFVVIMNIVGICFCVSVLFNLGNSQSEEEIIAKQFLEDYEDLQSSECNKVTIAQWNHDSNITPVTSKLKLDASLHHAEFQRELWHNVTKFNWTTFQDPDLKRKFKFLSVLGTAILPTDEYKQLKEALSETQTTYSNAKICDYEDSSKCDLSLEPELTALFTKNRDPKVLEHAWIKWRDQSGKKMRSTFEKYIELRNKAARLNKFKDATEEKLLPYESESFRSDVQQLWIQLKPFYTQLHAYVRNKLRIKYGDDVISATGPIPAHLLGNMWAQAWGNTLDFTEPYPGKMSVDVTPNMIKQGYTPLKMFKVAEEFFTSLNLSAMPDSFWINSVIEKPDDGRDLVCHASAWDFCDGKDVRIKECTSITMKDLIVVHHEMGHIQYFIQYKDQPIVYREGANPGFHEAIGDVLALSASTPKHLEKIGLFPNREEDPEVDMNFLFLTAMDKVAFLPFGYIMDLWRWDIFSGKTSPEHYNCDWWKYRIDYQGVRPPVERSEDDFDPGAKYHIAADVGYIRYFVSTIIQFQFHKSLCLLADEYDPNDVSKPLYKCDIYQNKIAGNKLADMLQLGSSKPWPEALSVLTGSSQMDASALLEYFKPLHDYLIEENKKSGEHIGWDTDNIYCSQSVSNTEKPQE